LRGRVTYDPDLRKDVPNEKRGKDWCVYRGARSCGTNRESRLRAGRRARKTIFKPCAACHATDHANRVGPGLGGLIGRKAGTVPGFPYSDAMKESDVVWDAKILNAYVESPQQVVPGNRMPYAGLKNPTDRMDLVAYLATLK